MVCWRPERTPDVALVLLMAQYLIRDLAQITGVKAHTIRTWEVRYGLLCPRRTANNLRHYDENDLRRLLHVASLCSHGWRISRVMQLSEAERAQAAAKLQATVSTTFTARLNALMTAMLDLDEPRLHYLLTDAINDQGLEPVMLHLVYPFPATGRYGVADWYSQHCPRASAFTAYTAEALGRARRATLFPTGGCCPLAAVSA